MKPIHPEVVRLQGRMFEARLKVGEVLNRAGLSRATWSRWLKHGMEPHASSVAKMDSAIDHKVMAGESIIAGMFDTPNEVAGQIYVLRSRGQQPRRIRVGLGDRNKFFASLTHQGPLQHCEGGEMTLSGLPVQFDPGVVGIVVEA